MNYLGKTNIILKVILSAMILLLLNTNAYSLYSEEIENNHYGFLIKNDEYTERDVIIVGGDNYYPPYEFIDKSGNYRGFNVDILKAIAEVMDIEIQFIPLPWELVMRGLEEGELDVVQGMTITESRLEKFAFTDQILVNYQNIFVRKDTTYISEVIDLPGHSVSFQKDDVSVEKLRTISGINFLKYENQTQAIKSLLSSESDAFIGNRETGLYNLQKMKLLDKVKIVGEPIGEPGYAIAAKIGNEDLLEVFNEGLSIIKANGEYEKIYNKWFGESFNDKSEQLFRYLILLGLILFVFVVVFQVVVLINRRLKEEVENRTKELTVKQLELEKANRKKDNIIETIESGLIAFNSNYEVSLFNRASEKILGKNLHPGQSWDDLSLSLYGIGSRDLLKDNNSISEKASFRNLKGEKRYIEYTISKLMGPSGIEGLMLYLRDYTTEKMLQDIISHDDKIMTLGRLLAGITHEIKNPLSLIKNYVEKLPEKKDDSNFISIFSKVVDDEITRLSSMVSSVLDFSRNGAIVLEKVYIEEVLRDILLLFKVKMVETRVMISYDVGDICINVDVQQLKQILINLILNSIEALDHDGSGKIHILAYEDEKNINIQVKDNGYGIPNELLDKVFDPFYTSKEEGHGVGLYITKQLMAGNSGDIFIDSIEDEGTTVTLKFIKFSD